MSTPWIEMTMTTYQEMKADNEKLREENSQLKDEIEKLNKMKSIKWSREFACPEIKKLREKIQHLEERLRGSVDPDKIFVDLAENTKFLQWDNLQEEGKTFVEYIQHLEKENERLKICFNAEESEEEEEEEKHSPRSPDVIRFGCRV